MYFAHEKRDDAVNGYADFLKSSSKKERGKREKRK